MEHTAKHTAKKGYAAPCPALPKQAACQTAMRLSSRRAAKASALKLTLRPGFFRSVVAALGAGVTLRRMPGHIDDERLLGGIDLAASLASGRPVHESGLIAQARGGALLCGMAERLDGRIAGRLARLRVAIRDVPGELSLAK